MANPVPSDQLSDLKLNMETTDEFVSSDSFTATARPTPTNPAGKSVRTLAGINNEAQTSLDIAEAAATDSTTALGVTENNRDDSTTALGITQSNRDNSTVALNITESNRDNSTIAKDTAEAAAGDAVVSKDSAAAYADVSASNANFAGNWSDLSGAYNVPTSVYEDEKYWQLLSNAPDITTIQPGVSSQWALIRGTTSNPPSPRDYGAALDGITDDTAAVQALLDSDFEFVDLTGGKNILFGDVNITKRKIVVSTGGFIKGGRILITDVNSTDTPTNRQGVKILGVNFDYSFNNSGDEAILVTNSICIVKDCSFARLGNQFPLRFEKAEYMEFDGNAIENCTFGIENISVQGVSTPATSKNRLVKVTNNRFRKISSSAINFRGVLGTYPSPEWESGWDRSNSFFDSCLVSNNVIEEVTGFALVFRSWFLVFTCNIVDNCDAPTMQGGSITCTNNRITNSPTIGLDFGNVTDGVMVNNSVSNTEFAGIEINSSFNVVVQSNHVRNTCINPPSVRGSTAIWVHGASSLSTPPRECRNITIIGNLMGVGANGNNTYGISIEDVAAQAAIAFNQMQGSAQTTEIIAEGTDVVSFLNPNNFTMTNQRIDHQGTLNSITLPTI